MIGTHINQLLVVAFSLKFSKNYKLNANFLLYKKVSHVPVFTSETVITKKHTPSCVRVTEKYLLQFHNLYDFLEIAMLKNSFIF